MILFAPNVLAGGDITVTSVDLTDNVDGNFNPKTEQWLINTVLNGGGQRILGTISPTELQSSSGFKSEKTLEIDAEVLETFSFPIDNTDTEQIVKYKLEDVNVGKFSWGVWQRPARCSGDFIFAIGGRVWYGQEVIGYICYDQSSVGNRAELDPGNVNFKADIEARVGNERTEVTITNKDISSFDFPNNKISVRWTGSLATGSSIPDHRDVYPVLQSGGNSWKLVSDNLWDDYSEQKNEVSSEFTRFISGERVVTSCDSKHGTITSGEEAIQFVGCHEDFIKEKTILQNSLANEVLKGGASLGQFSGTIPKSQDAFTIESTATTLNPNLLFRVDADWIGIVIPEGKPEVISAKQVPDKFVSGEPSRIDVQVKNVGSHGDSFTIALDSCSGFEQTFSSEAEFIEAGQTETISIDFSSDSSNEDATNTCKGTVKALNSGETDTFSFIASKEKANSCNPGEFLSFGNRICQCTDDGKIPDNNECKLCEHGVTFDDNAVPQCKESSIKCPTGFTEGKKSVLGIKYGKNICLPDDDDGITTSELIKIISASLVGLISIFAGGTLIRKINTSASPGLVVIASLIIGALMSILVFVSFWFLIAAGILTALAFFARGFFK